VKHKSCGVIKTVPVPKVRLDFGLPRAFIGLRLTMKDTGRESHSDWMLEWSIATDLGLPVVPQSSPSVHPI
jgi:hypothetical protein